MRDNASDTARLARHICWRELGEYTRAASELGDWSRRLGLGDQLTRRLDTHRAKFSNRRFGAIVGSPALLLEQRLLTQDVQAITVSGKDTPDLKRYFHQNPKNINIEYDEDTEHGDIFFRRVSLTSC